jgi:Zn-dependent protease with chaperone function
VLFRSIGISSRWIDHPLDDVKLLKHFEAVLAHEFAHARLSHMPKRVILSYLTSLILTIHLAEKTFNNKSKEERYKAALINSFLSWAIKPRIDKLLSRLQEFQADAYGASWTSAQQMAEALEFLKLSFGSSVHGDTIKWLKNGSKESHPSMDLRIKRLKDADIEHRSVWADWRCWLTW